MRLKLRRQFIKFILAFILFFPFTESLAQTAIPSLPYQASSPYGKKCAEYGPSRIINQDKYSDPVVEYGHCIRYHYCRQSKGNEPVSLSCPCRMFPLNKAANLHYPTYSALGVGSDQEEAVGEARQICELKFKKYVAGETGNSNDYFYQFGDEAPPRKYTKKSSGLGATGLTHSGDNYYKGCNIQPVCE